MASQQRTILHLIAFFLVVLYAFLLAQSSIRVFEQQAAESPFSSVFEHSPDTIVKEREMVGLQKSSNFDDEFSACLLVMDDNHFLIEWLAYHYHVLPLRHLIVSVDPRSRTSPDDILDRWRQGHDPMTIVRWNDSDFMMGTDRAEAEYFVNLTFGPKISYDLIQHRARQRLFYYRCMQTLKKQGRRWTLLTDSDEFLLVNYPTVQAFRLKSPPIAEPGSVMSLLKQELQRPGNNLSTPCVQVPRIRFGARESFQHEVQREWIPPTFNASTFQTLRWRKHATSDNYPFNRISKVMIDLHRVKDEELSPVDSIHRPIRSMCLRRRLHIRAHEQVFIIHHYLGTWEQYEYREDSRAGAERSFEAWTKTARIDQQTDDNIRPWLSGFVNSQGLDRARYVLQRVGDLI